MFAHTNVKAPKVKGMLLYYPHEGKLPQTLPPSSSHNSRLRLDSERTVNANLPSGWQRWYHYTENPPDP